VRVAERIYLVAAIAGAIVPYVFFISFFAEYGIALPSFLAGVFANGAAGGFPADIFISSAVFWTLMMSRRTPYLWVYIVVNLTIGLSCALPLWLWREEVRNRAERQDAV
tara:strand:- start:152 stop:478 length:327 start_codon:yes stop_codon:yes gene_type:complete